MLDNDISPEQRKCLETAFEAADKNGDGILSADEYYEIFQTHGLSIGKKKTNTIMNFKLLFLIIYICFIQERKSRKKCKKGCCCSVCRKGIVEFKFTCPIYKTLNYTYYLKQTSQRTPRDPFTLHKNPEWTSTEQIQPKNTNPMSMQCIPSM